MSAGATSEEAGVAAGGRRELVAAAGLVALVVAAYASGAWRAAGVCDDYWLLWEGRDDSARIEAVWNGAGRFANGWFYRVVWSGLREVEDLRRVRLVGCIGIGLLAVALYVQTRRLDYSRGFAFVLAGLVSLLPTFGYYSAYATAAGHVYGCVAALAAFALADRTASGSRGAAFAGWIGAALVQTLALGFYQPAGMFYVVPCLLTLASDACAVWTQATTWRVVRHGTVCVAALAASFAIYRSAAQDLPTRTGESRGAFTTDVVVKAGRFAVQPLAQSCLPFHFTTHWSNGRRAALGAVVLGVLVPCGLAWRLSGPFRGRLARIVGLYALLPIAYLPNLVVASDFFPYRTRPALAACVLTLLAAAVAGAARRWAGDERLRNRALALSGSVALITALAAARTHVHEGVVEPSVREWATVRAVVESEARRAPRPSAVTFVRPPSTAAGVTAVYDEFWYRTTNHDWPGRGMTGLAVERTAPDSLDAFRLAPFASRGADEPVERRDAANWLLDVAGPLAAAEVADERGP